MEKDLKTRDQVETKVGTGILVSGRIEGEGNVFIEGRVDGEIRIKGDLHIDASGQVKADIQARNVFVYGILVGNAEALEKVEIAEGGRMLGDVRSPRFLINEGAAFSGVVDMVDFEEEDRSGEPRPSARRPARPAATVGGGIRTGRPPAPPARTPNTPPPSYSPSAKPTPRPVDSGSNGSPAKSLYTPPPLPKAPDVAGVRKAIIIKKKPGAEGP